MRPGPPPRWRGRRAPAPSAVRRCRARSSAPGSRVDHARSPSSRALQRSGVAGQRAHPLEVGQRRVAARQREETRRHLSQRPAQHVAVGVLGRAQEPVEIERRPRGIAPSVESNPPRCPPPARSHRLRARSARAAAVPRSASQPRFTAPSRWRRAGRSSVRASAASASTSGDSSPLSGALRHRAASSAWRVPRAPPPASEASSRKRTRMRSRGSSCSGTRVEPSSPPTARAVSGETTSGCAASTGARFATAGRRRPRRARPSSSSHASASARSAFRDAMPALSLATGPRGGRPRPAASRTRPGRPLGDRARHPGNGSPAPATHRRWCRRRRRGACVVMAGDAARR